MKTRETSNDLTSREQEVLYFASKGLNTKMIAEILSISYETAKTHRKNILIKSNASNIAEAIYKYMTRVTYYM